MKNVLNKIKRVYDLSEEALSLLTSRLRLVNFPKGYILFEEGRTEKYAYFIERGIARAFCRKDDKEITFWFGSEGEMLFSYNSYISAKPGYETVELLEEAILYEVSLSDLQELFLNNLELANWGRKLAETELIKTEERFISYQFTPAIQRYEELLNSNPDLLQRVSLGQIASFLGVTQVTLSRIRADFR
ncbi:cAMP-binding domain of CRP or a regulatory subunit of cAMP-dependent protein kinases [Pseudarcicella hirudinis]|uniref:cAMP-binding domain of CRP or a regulatory subunit of cAMP-dependent protein kinases n=1 Tax=Pseudarcicella hirudinis TaxID=1079859 RepID=A0A1I5VE30_9BACT|nr:Crp/Fnr family transcriptional regulator [Pseudarcicella hirudinis]SFQ05740.1 cAMP-binding domain of CRP or a regulatory subunit of cAMP-dependent protein kinases [Pseudarcicella hirudinis]